MSVAVIQLETQDFVSAARRLELWAADPLELATTRLSNTLAESFAMAGSDPGGTSWAGSYDPAARSALYAGQDAINSVHRLAAMFAQTARNYAAADAASTAGVRRLVGEAVAALPDVGGYFLGACIPTAAGGSGERPSGWGLIEHAVGWVWPNGHQDRLRAAAQSWRASAAAFADAAGQVIDASGLAITDRLPEADDMWRVCEALAGQLREVGEVHAALADACEQLAEHLDHAHSEVVGELTSLIEWTAAIEVGGGLLSVVTFGAAEVVSQAAEAARIASTAARIGAIIERFTALARDLAQTVAAVTERADRVAGAMAGLLDARLSTAVVTSVRTLPGAGRIVELGSLARLRLTMRHDWPRISGMLQTAAREKGHYGIGAVSRHEADLIGRAWVGDGAKFSKDGTAWISEDGLRQYRPFAYKHRSGVWQANIQWRVTPRGSWLSNGHLDLRGRP